MSAVQRFARVLRASDVARLLGAAVLARMPIGIDSLAMVLFVRAETGSFARAGLVAAAFGLGVGFSAPVLGRLIDRHGHARVMLPPAGLHAASLGALVAFGLAGAPTGVLAACGLAAGISVPPVGSVVRPLLAGLLDDDAGLLPTAYALDGIAIELVFVTVPLLTAAIVVVASPAVALLVACGFVVLGTVVLVTRRRRARGGRTPATTSATCSAPWPRRACARSSPRPRRWASPSAPPR
jgi:MFS family permease